MTFRAATSMDHLQFTNTIPTTHSTRFTFTSIYADWLTKYIKISESAIL